MQQTSRGKIALERQVGQLEPLGSKPRAGGGDDELAALSQIIASLNDRFGLNLGPSTASRSSTFAARSIWTPVSMPAHG